MFKNPSGFVYGSGNLVQFRAGRMNLVDKMVHADNRKGLLYIRQEDDGLLHFCWKDRDTGDVDEDLILIPNDFEYKRVEQCKTGRVYVLIFKSSTRRLFFWMQEAKTDKDDEYCKRINELINKPPGATNKRHPSASSRSFLKMSHQELMNIFGNSSDGQTATVTSTTIDNFLTGLRNGDLSAGGDLTTAVAAATLTSGSHIRAPKRKIKKKKSKPTKKSVGIDLNDAFYGFSASKPILDILSDPDRVNKLANLLPKTEDDSDDRKQLIKDHISTPDFQLTMTEFSTAFPSEILGGIMRSLKLPIKAVTAATSGDLKSFLNALEVQPTTDVVVQTEVEAPGNPEVMHSEKRKREPESEPDEQNSKRK